ncbi:DNA alkylation repair protein [Patescibacteria group bacterium]|nr:DNA alkylation repair protein [Patescibacteria group bacterium]
MTKLNQLKKELRAVANADQALVLQRFFKTAPGEYGAGDKFLGVTVVEQRRIARGYRDLALNDCARLLDSPWHEERLFALIIMTEQFKRADELGRQSLFNLYCKKLDHINNWDLVDLSADRIYGEWFRLTGRDPRAILRRLVKSKNLWHRRIAMLATFAFIKQGQFNEALDIAERLLTDQHDLIHKAVGWLLREIGNRNRAVEEKFLRSRYQKMPRTMLRYAIEKFPESRRKKYLSGEI